MKIKHLLILCTLAFLLYATVAMAQQGLDDSNVTVNEEVNKAVSMLDTPVAGVGFSLISTYVSLMSAISAATTGIGSSFTASFRGLATSLVVLYITVIGILCFRGYFPNVKQEVVTLFLLMFVTQIVFNPGNYQDWIAGPILETIKSVGDFFVTKSTGGLSGSMLQVLGDGMDKIMAVCVKINNAAEILSPKLLISGVIAEIALTLTYVAVIIVFLLINVTMWFGIYLLNVFGAICLYFAIFPVTRHIFFAWLRAIINYGLVIVFVSLILGVCLKVMTPRLDILAVMDFGTVNPLLNSATFIVIAINVLCWCMLLKAPDFAAALTGGSAGNTAGIAGVVSMTGGAAYGGAKSLIRNRFSAGGGGAAPGGGNIGAAARSLGRGVRSASARRGIE
ncbi:type IV secretion system protein [Desulfovibrio sp. UIB00]|uniref:type IV secretion system protein n=1 Tax=Desulfovibrio sp. UIB00 TaxID=2804314 RepID=UPI001F0EAA85|nr:type IV secretion system protein [Desulfovibrio sp. UIB00]MCH5146353.1 type IV secretion system protein [Desulfovibrio sp. UIB00]